MPNNNLTIALTFLAYLALMLGIGLYAWRRTDNLADFVLGGVPGPPERDRHRRFFAAFVQR